MSHVKPTRRKQTTRYLELAASVENLDLFHGGLHVVALGGVTFDPGVPEGLHGRHALLGVQDQQLANQVLPPAAGLAYRLLPVMQCVWGSVNPVCIRVFQFCVYRVIPILCV